MSYPHTDEVITALFTGDDEAIKAAATLLSQYQKLCRTLEGQVENMRTAVAAAETERDTAVEKCETAKEERDAAVKRCTTMESHPDVKAARLAEVRGRLEADMAELKALGG